MWPSRRCMQGVSTCPWFSTRPQPAPTSSPYPASPAGRRENWPPSCLPLPTLTPLLENTFQWYKIVIQPAITIHLPLSKSIRLSSEMSHELLVEVGYLILLQGGHSRLTHRGAWHQIPGSFLSAHCFQHETDNQASVLLLFFFLSLTTL